MAQRRLMAKVVLLVASALALVCLYACAQEERGGPRAAEESRQSEEGSVAGAIRETMVIRVSTADAEAIFRLNDGSAAKDLYDQLPLELELQPYSDNEITFYPSRSLNVNTAPLQGEASRGSLSYYEPWGDVVMFYGPQEGSSDLYSLGECIAGADAIESMSGTAIIDTYSKE